MLLEKMGFAGKVEIVKKEDADATDKEDSEENYLVCNIAVAEDSSFLIGQYGANLQALQHIIRLLVRKQEPARINFIVDVNFYRQQKTHAIMEQAAAAVAQALAEKKAVILKPMSAYERRLVHMELSKNKNIITESVGTGEDRRVAVKPAEL